MKKIEIYVLTSRCGTEMDDAQVFTDKTVAREKMEAEYESALKWCKEEICEGDEPIINDSYALIPVSSEYREWQLATFELEI